jgi:hypothetical protein
MQVNVGEVWVGNYRDRFTVINKIEQNGKVWIHYRNINGTEFSCWEESFVHRFRKDVS